MRREPLERHWRVGVLPPLTLYARQIMMQMAADSSTAVAIADSVEPAMRWMSIHVSQPCASRASFTRSTFFCIGKVWVAVSSCPQQYDSMMCCFAVDLRGEA